MTTQAQKFLTYVRPGDRRVDIVHGLREAAKHDDGPILGYTDTGAECARWPDGSALVSSPEGWRVETPSVS